MTDIQRFYNLVITACNDPNIGYSQAQRTTIKLGETYRTYCDCSSLISWALTGAGFLNPNPWFTTSTMINILLNHGFVEVPYNGAWQAGDIVWKTGHTEVVYNGAKYYTMGAHTDGVAFPDQVSIGNYSNKNYFTRIFRYNGSTPPIPPGGRKNWWLLALQNTRRERGIY